MTYLALITSQVLVDHEEHLILGMRDEIELLGVLCITIVISNGIERVTIGVALSRSGLLALLATAEWNILLVVDLGLCHLRGKVSQCCNVVGISKGLSRCCAMVVFKDQDEVESSRPYTPRWRLSERASALSVLA